jgi:peroxiredoxin
MSSTVYNALAGLLALSVLAAFIVVVISFVAMLIRWRHPNRRRHLVRLLLAIAAIPCLIGIQQLLLWQVFLPSLGRQQMAKYKASRDVRTAEASKLRLGDRAPDFSLTTADGADFRLSDAKGSVVLINFFATWCGPCQQELPHIEAIGKEHRANKRFQLLVIGREESVDAVREYRAKSGFSFPIAADPDRAVYSLFADQFIPRTVVISPDGHVVYSQAGFYEEDMIQLRAVIKHQLAALPQQ